jgi:hypothetical protein
MWAQTGAVSNGAQKNGVCRSIFLLYSEKGFSVAAWKVEGATQAYRYFRIRQTGKNSGGLGSGLDHVLFCAGIELYGMLLIR